MVAQAVVHIGDEDIERHATIQRMGIHLGPGGAAGQVIKCSLPARGESASQPGGLCRIHRAGNRSPSGDRKAPSSFSVCRRSARCINRRTRCVPWGIAPDSMDRHVCGGCETNPQQGQVGFEFKAIWISQPGVCSKVIVSLPRARLQRTRPTGCVPSSIERFTSKSITGAAWFS